MADEAKPTAEREPASLGLSVRAALLAWLVPGLGHFQLGRRRRAAVFAVLVGIAIVVGVRLQGNLDHALPGRPLSYVLWLASMGMGAPYFALERLLGHAGDITSVGYDYGTAFLRSAGVMNLLLVLDAWDIARGRKE